MGAWLSAVVGAKGDVRQRAIAVLFAVLFVAWSVLVLYHGHGRNGYVQGDWLLDYRQGFIRRGLMGAMLSGLAGLTHVSVTWWVCLAQIAQFGAFLGLLLVILADRFKPFWYVLLLCSPATVLFSFFGIAGVGRKETLYFALLAWFVWGLSRQRVSWRLILLWTLASAVITLSHELVLFYAPYFLIAAVAAGGPQRQQALWAAGLMWLASWLAGAAVLLWAHPIDSQAYCDSLIGSGLPASVCQGIVMWPHQTLSASIQDTLVTIDYFEYPKVYVLALLLALLPVLPWLRRYRRSVVLGLSGWFVLAWLCSAAAFVLAVDWGRFIQIHMVSTLLVLALKLRQFEPDGAVAKAPLFTWGSTRVRWGLAMACLLAPLFWHMPTCCEGQIGGGATQKATHLAEAVVRKLKR